MQPIDFDKDYPISLFLISLAQNDYMIDGNYLPEGLSLLEAARVIIEVREALNTGNYKVLNSLEDNYIDKL